MVAAGLCVAHKKRRRLGLTLGWGGFILGLVSIFTGMAMPQGTLLGLGFLLLFSAALVGIIVARIVYASKINESHVWLKGCGTEFLDSLPPLP
jgi:hypothetical protein